MMMGFSIPISFSNAEFPILMSSHEIPISWPCYVETPASLWAVQSLHRQFKPPPSQNQTVGFSVAPKKRDFFSIQPEKPVVQPMHKILIMYFNYKYKIKSAFKSQQEFLNSLHLTVCHTQGFCKCESHRLLLVHFDKCQDTSCSLCVPVRLLCFSRNPNQPFLNGVDCRAQESQPVCKRRRMEKSVQNDIWSLHEITGHHSKPQSSEGPLHIGETDLLRSSKKRNGFVVAQETQPVCKHRRVENIVQNDNCSPKSFEGPLHIGESDLLRSSNGFDDNKKMGNENPVSSSQGAVEMQETGYGYTPLVISYDPGSNYDYIWDLAESADLMQSKEENSGSIGRKLPNEIEAPHGEEITTVLEMQEKGSVVSCQVKGCDENLNSDHQCDMENSYYQSRDKSDDLIQTMLNEEIPCSTGDIGELVLSSSYDFEDMNKGCENAISDDEEEMNKYLEELEVECADKGDGQSLKSNDECDIAKSDCQSGRGSEDLKASAVSFIDSFTPEQIKDHLLSLNPHTHLTSANGLSEIRTVDENTCRLCHVGGRKFCPAPMYCTCCEAQIKPLANYYKPPEDGTSVKHSFCTSCFRLCKANISFKGLSFSKAKLVKCRHDEEDLEGWVQCDNCKAWQHQICALYNSKQDSGGDLEYVCPVCRLIEMEEKVHAPIRPAFGARDLPRTKLSDFIEERVFRSLEKERKRRAKLLGKSPDEVPTAEDLVVRVVLASNKKLKVKQEFLDILNGETYPTEFPYKSKMLLLFQKFEGVDVCIFAMYLQEFGSECGHPNNRSIYISYLDSVKYFRPEIKTVDGVALRTFVYQQILIGYLDYCKQLGFSKCYIWACPPTKGEDYILYCHPETQKTPNNQKLLQWYKKMLRKAKEESVVVEYTNFYDSFFVPNSRITTAKLPYFDGDYWSSSIGNMIRIIDEETKESKKKVKTKRSLRAMGQSHGSEDISKDMLVMQKLGQVMLPSKEEFFVVHLQFTCSNCHEPILSGTRLSCNQCSKFHICHRCAQVGRTHTRIHGERHQLLEVRVNDVPADTEDGDLVLDNDIFNDRIGFLMFCQENHLQFDSVRRAKHSTMMILYHLRAS